MERDWKIIESVVVLLILSDGIDNIYNVTSNKMVIGPSLNSFYYLPSILLTIGLMLFILLFVATKHNIFYKLLSGSILIYGIYIIAFTLLTLSPLFKDYWYIMVLGILIGIFEFNVGKKMLNTNKYK